MKMRAVQALLSLSKEKFESELNALYEQCKQVVSAQGDYVVY
jgi:hypothetical protein